MVWSFTVSTFISFIPKFNIISTILKIISKVQLLSVRISVLSLQQNIMLFNQIHPILQYLLFHFAQLSCLSDKVKVCIYIIIISVQQILPHTTLILISRKQRFIVLYVQINSYLHSNYNSAMEDEEPFTY